MISGSEFVRQSLELHLFFARIMKEHSLFLATAFTQKDLDLIQQANALGQAFDKLLVETVSLAQGIVSESVLQSGEVVTPFTLQAEMVTSYFTGVHINTQLTQKEQELRGDHTTICSSELQQCVEMINQNAIGLVTSLINFKAKVLSEVLSCDIFTRNYPTMLQHLIHEAKAYLSMIQKLKRHEMIVVEQEAYAQEAFWNDIMGEHAEFIRGLLDPSEKQLIVGAESFIEEFEELTKKAKKAMEGSMPAPGLTSESMRATEDIQDFKKQATQGLLECKIQSVIIPLLSDHVLREANHYLRLLRIFK